MANLPQYQSFTGLPLIYQGAAPRGIANELYTVVPPAAGGGAARPTEGQAWPRGNTRGNS